MITFYSCYVSLLHFFNVLNQTVCPLRAGAESEWFLQIPTPGHGLTYGRIISLTGMEGRGRGCGHNGAPLLVLDLRFSIICLDMDVGAFQRPCASLNDGIRALALLTEPRTGDH